MKLKNYYNVAAITMAATMSSQAATVFTDTFSYAAINDFTGEGGWTTVIGAIGTDIGTDAAGFLWGINGALEYNHTTIVAEGDEIAMNANIQRFVNYPYIMTLDLWDGADAGTRVEAATSNQTSGVAALTELTYTVTAADILAGRDHVIFHYGHGNNWGETADVTFDVTTVPEPSSAALLGLGGLALIFRRRK